MVRFFTKPRSSSLNRESRTIPIHTIPVPGSNDELFRCWNCGYVCNVATDTLGGSSDRNGLSYSDAYSPSYGNTAAVLGGDLGMRLAALAQNADGTDKTVVNSKKVDADSGCPLCGTLNWRGDFP